MWPSKKDRGIAIPPGGSIEIGFGVEWKRDKNEVVIITDKEKFVLNGKNELFLEVTSDNANPVRVQIVPDFRKRVINIVEVLDANTKQKTDGKKGKISLVGIGESKVDPISIDEHLKKWDEKIDMFGKRIKMYKMRKNKFMIFAAIVAISNIYLFAISNGPTKYINVVAVAIIVYASLRLHNAYRDLHKSYEEYKEQRSKAFEVAKDT